MRKNRKRRPINNPNSPIPAQSNGHNRSASTVITSSKGVSTKTRNTVDNLNQLLDADSLDEDENGIEEEEENSGRNRKIWLALIGLVVLGWMVAQAFNGLKQYQVKDIPSTQAIEPAPVPTITAPSENIGTKKVADSALSERDSYFDLAKQGYEQVIADYVGANGQRLYMDAISQQSKGKSAYRILLQKQATVIKQHEMIISKNESLAVSNPDVMRLIGISLDAQSVLNALQRLCQSKNNCDGIQNFNDFTVPSADALVHLRMYNTEEITAFTQNQEFQVRKQIINEEARKKPDSKQPVNKAPANKANEKGGNQTSNNNPVIQRNN
jgi:hypothetical protein